MPSTPPIDVNDGKWPAWHCAQYMTLWDFPTWQYIYVLVIAITMVEVSPTFCFTLPISPPSPPPILYLFIF